VAESDPESSPGRNTGEIHREEMETVSAGVPSRESRRLIQIAGAGMVGILSSHVALGQTSPKLPAQPGIFDVTDFGAKGDGSTLDTDAINHAIASAAQSGETVYAPGRNLFHSFHPSAGQHHSRACRRSRHQGGGAGHNRH
jgi:Pectate lyase superfamily protein